MKTKRFVKSSLALCLVAVATNGSSDLNTETATMTLQPGTGYKVGRNNQTTVSINDSP